MPSYVVLVTASSAQEGEKLARILLENKLAACVNRVPRVQSLYWWQGEIQSSEEELLIIKTDKVKFKELLRAVKKNHSYTVPEVIALRIKEGNRDYLQWIRESLGLLKTKKPS